MEFTGMVVFEEFPKLLSFCLKKKEKKNILKRWERVLRDELGWFHLNK